MRTRFWASKQSFGNQYQGSNKLTFITVKHNNLGGSRAHGLRN